MQIIDTHVHLGTSRFSGVNSNETDIMKAMDAHGIFTSLVMPQPTLEDIPSVHKKIFNMSKKFPHRIFGMTSIDPWITEEEYYLESVKCLEEYHFVALKLHPLGHNISPLSPLCNKIYELAEKYHVPVLIHTGIGNPFSLPSLIIEPAKKFPKVTFILAHAGFAVYTDEALVAAKVCDNIILEPSWCPTYTVQKMIDQIGDNRIIMGSDHITNIPVELAKYHSINITDSQLEKILYKNASQIFNLESKKECLFKTKELN